MGLEVRTDEGLGMVFASFPTGLEEGGDSAPNLIVGHGESDVVSKGLKEGPCLSPVSGEAGPG